jgi:Uncharacterized conserved protein, contains S4-like domain
VSVYEHFRPEEKPLIDQYLDWKDQVTREFAPKLADFLDPRQQKILELIIGKNEDVHVAFSGGFQNAERKRALLLPPYIPEEEEAFELACVEVAFASKFVTLSHPELLGALTGTGVNRDKIGDLIVTDDQAQFICSKDIEPYLLLNLTAVGKNTVACHSIGSGALIHNEQNWVESWGTVSSLRLDVVASEIYHLSRTKTAELIDRKQVRINWELMDKRDFELAEGDMLSLRGFGRSKIISVDGLTKKHKIRLQYGKLY